MLRKMFILAALFPLVGCGYLTKESVNVKPPAIQENAKARCPEIDPLVSPASMGDLHRFAMDTVDEYNECSARHDTLIDIVNSR